MTNMMRTMKMILLIVACCACTATLTGYQYEQKMKSKSEDREKIIAVEVEKQMTGEILEDALHDVSKLITEVYSYTEKEKSFDSVKVGNHKIPLTESGFVYSYDGIIYAGVDFEKIQVVMDSNSKTITITMPEAEVISKDLDKNSLQVYVEKNNIFNPISIEDMNCSMIDLENRALDKAIEKGLLDRAADNARRQVDAFVSGVVGRKEYRIEFL